MGGSSLSTIGTVEDGDEETMKSSMQLPVLLNAQRHVQTSGLQVNGGMEGRFAGATTSATMVDPLTCRRGQAQ